MKRVRFKDIEQIPRLSVKKEFKQDFFGAVPAPFIGRFGYPNVHVGVLSPQQLGPVEDYDSPKLWGQKGYSIGEIASKRYGMVNSHSAGNVKKLKGRFLEIVQEVGMSNSAVEMEVNLDRKPQLKLSREKEIIPFGPHAEMKKARITSNPRVDSRVERIVSDTDLKAVPGILNLYKKGFEENFLTKLLSVGNTGIGKNRCLVPTRWSITAVDDTVGKELLKEVKNYSVGEYTCYFGGGWGNYYLVLMFPEVWSYELFEMYLGYKINPWSQEGNFYSTDYEGFKGRKDYAHECAGGYYAAKLPVLEKMKAVKRQGSALVLRFITPEYTVPLGVWVCREAIRKSLMEKPLSFGSEELMMKYAAELVSRKLGFDIGILLKESKLLKEKKQQKKIWEFN